MASPPAWWSAGDSNVGQVLAGVAGLVWLRRCGRRATGAVPLAAMASISSATVVLPYAVYLSRNRVPVCPPIYDRAGRSSRCSPRGTVREGVRHHRFFSSSRRRIDGRPLRATISAPYCLPRSAQTVVETCATDAASPRARRVLRADRLRTASVTVSGIVAGQWAAELSRDSLGRSVASGSRSQPRRR